MRTIAIISQKGGAGKTTLAVHLAGYAEQSGLMTAVIDLDPQATAAKWGDRREEMSPEVISAQAVRLPQLLTAARDGGANLTIIDTAPNSDSTALAAAKTADLILEPLTKPSLDEVPANERSGEERRGKMDVGLTLVTAGQAAVAVEPSQRPLDDPAVWR